MASYALLNKLNCSMTMIQSVGNLPRLAAVVYGPTRNREDTTRTYNNGKNRIISRPLATIAIKESSPDIIGTDCFNNYYSVLIREFKGVPN